VVSEVREVERLVAPDRVREALVVRVPREVADIAVALFALIAVDVRLVVSAFKLSTEPAPPLLGDILMFPVVFPPSVRVLFLTVWRDPAPVKYVALLEAFALIEAVGVPELTLMNANLEEEVAVDPKSRSRVEARLGWSAPEVILQSSPDAAAHDPQTGALPESDTRQRPVVEVVTDESTPVVAVPYTTALFPVNRVSIVPSAYITPSTSKSPCTKRSSSVVAEPGAPVSPIDT